MPASYQSRGQTMRQKNFTSSSFLLIVLTLLMISLSSWIADQGVLLLLAFCKDPALFVWFSGTRRPVRNQWAWTSVKNMICLPILFRYKAARSTWSMRAMRGWVLWSSFWGTKCRVWLCWLAQMYVPYIASCRPINPSHWQERCGLIHTSIVMSLSLKAWDSCIRGCCLLKSVVGSVVSMLSFVKYWEPLLQLSAPFMSQIQNYSNMIGRRLSQHISSK